MPKRLKAWKDYAYHTDFSSALKCAQDEETVGKFLSVASLADLKKFIPEEALTEGFEDLLPIAANACVVNMANARGDMISTSVALEIYQFFKNKFIDIEHDRKTIVGHLTTSGFSKFAKDYLIGAGSEPLTADEVKDMTEPFNICLGGYVYAMAYPGVVSAILKANDPNDEIYLGVGLSWEMAFDSYKIALGSAVLSECEVLDSPEDIEKYKPFLKCNGGTGLTNEGVPVYRLLTEGVLPLGVGLTFAPAAAVAGVITPAKMMVEANMELSNEQLAEINKQIKLSEADLLSLSAIAKASPVFSTTLASLLKKTEEAPIVTEPKKEEPVTEPKKEDKTQENISQATKGDVTTNIRNSMKTLKTFEELKSLNDETAKDYSFANVSNVIEAEVAKIAKDHQAKIEAEAAAKAAAEKNATDALASVAELKAEVKKMQDAHAAAEKTSKFNDRMTSLDEEFALNDAQRKSVASQIQDLDDTSFASWKTEIFEPWATKKTVAANTVTTTTETATTETPVKTEEKVEAKTEAVASTAVDAIKNAAAKKQAAIANVVVGEENLVEKFKPHFELGKGIEIVTAARR